MAKIHSHVAVGTVLLVLSLTVNVQQALRIRGLLNQGAPEPLVGMQAAPIEGWTPGGAPVTLAMGRGLPTVLYYFSPTCTWCEANWPAIDTLARQAEGRYRVIALTTARDLRPFADARNLHLDIVEGISPETMAQYRFSGTPHTVVVDVEGTIVQSWRGAYTGRVGRQVQEWFKMPLPEVIALPVDANPE